MLKRHAIKAISGQVVIDRSLLSMPKSTWPTHEDVLSLLSRPRLAPQTSQWHERRRIMITGTDVSSILGQNKYRSRSQLLLQKTGRVQNRIWSTAVEHGRKYEQEAADMFSLLTGEELVQEEIGLMIHPDCSFFGMTPDRVLRTRPCLVEIKCPFRAVIRHECPTVYYGQIQMQLEIANMPMCYLVQYKPATAWTFAEIDILEVPRNKVWFEKHRPELVNFWNEVVEYYKNIKAPIGTFTFKGSAEAQDQIKDSPLSKKRKSSDTDDTRSLFLFSPAARSEEAQAAQTEKKIKTEAQAATTSAATTSAAAQASPGEAETAQEEQKTPLSPVTSVASVASSTQQQDTESDLTDVEKKQRFIGHLFKFGIKVLGSDLPLRTGGRLFMDGELAPAPDLIVLDANASEARWAARVMPSSADGNGTNVAAAAAAAPVDGVAVGVEDVEDADGAQTVRFGKGAPLSESTELLLKQLAADFELSTERESAAREADKDASPSGPPNSSSSRARNESTADCTSK